jgi:GntR family transcriptional repressor for pyruvate dehydrogenase complex
MKRAAVLTKTFRPVQKHTVAAEIIEQVKSLMRRRRYLRGARLPSERDLAKELNVSRPSVREALRMLTLIGVLDTRHGSGTQVASSSSNVFKAPFEFLIMLDRPSIHDLYETRELIEVFLAGRAAERRTSEDLAALESALREMRRVLPDWAAMIEPDVRFHQAVAAAAHNCVLERVMGSLHDAIRSAIQAAIPGARDIVGSYKAHRKIFDAIRQKNPEAARRAVARHMDLTFAAIRRAGLNGKQKKMSRR